MHLKASPRLTLIFCIFASVYIAEVHAQKRPIGTSGAKTIIVEGVGETADKAIKDAFRNAIRQAVGAIVDAETIIKNDQIIEDQIITYSDAIIRQYEEIPGSREIRDGLHRIRIKAFVEKETLERRLQDAAIVVQDLDGEGLFAEAVTGFEKDQDAAALLQKTFDKFPVGVLTSSVVGKPKIIEKNESEATVDFIVRVGVNAEAYKKFHARLSKTLNSICEEPVKYSMECELNSQTNLIRLSTSGFRSYPGFLRKVTNTGDERIKVRAFFVASAIGKPLDCYRLNESLFIVADRVAKQKFVIKLSLLNEHGETIAEDAFDRHEIEVPRSGKSLFIPNLFSAEGISSTFASDLPPVYFVAPYFIERSTVLPQLSADIVSRRSFKLKLQELQAVKSTKVEIIPR